MTEIYVVLAFAVALIGSLIAATITGPRFLNRLIFERGDWPRAARWMPRLEFSLWPLYRERLELAVAEYSGRTDLAIQKAGGLVKVVADPGALNQCVTAFINAGRYRRALEVGASVKPNPYDRHAFWALIQVNLAEADYNL
jgi:hypothetical protein